MQSSTTSTGRRLATAAILGAGSAVLMAGTAHADGLFGAAPGAGGVGTAEDPHAGQVTLAGVATPVDTKLTVLETANNAPDHATDHLVWTYCIQRGVPVDAKGLYDEKGWLNEDAKLGIDPQNLQGIKWILSNSYPQKLDLTAIAASVNAVTPGAISTLTEKEAVEATQAAVWNLSDKADLDTASKANDANVIALYGYLKAAAATHLHDQTSPQLSLGISPSSVTGAKAGTTVGPFALTSSDGSKFIHVVFDTDKGDKPPVGAKIVDKNGNEVTESTVLMSGEKVSVQIPDGVSTNHIVLRAYGQLQALDTGRVFFTHDTAKPTQNLIVAASHNVYVRDYVDIKLAKEAVSPSTPVTTPSTPATTPPVTTPPAPAPSTPSLAHTGAGNTAALAGGALALVAAGGGLVVYTRRTKRQGAH
jgi:TQXA domain-containing protein/LPXTG-motif cell wall-anchored protein